MEARGSPRRLSQCWAGSLNEKLRASGSAGLSYRFTDLFFSRHFLPNSLIALAHAMKLRRMEMFFLQFAASRQHPGPRCGISVSAALSIEFAPIEAPRDIRSPLRSTQLLVSCLANSH